MGEHSCLDRVAAEFLSGFKDGLSSVRDVSGEFDHRVKARKAAGGYSTVFMTHWAPQHSPPIPVCYKELRPPAGDFPEQVNQTRKMMKHLTREVKIWKELSHPNIVEFIGFAIEGEGCDVKTILVSKWCANGDITKYLRKCPDVNRIQLIQDMGRGLQCLHSRDPTIIHGDLTPNNVVISDEGVAQLCDFGLARIVGEFTKSGRTTTTGPGCTTRYSAFEVVTGGTKTEKSDIYGFGCTCIHVLFDQRPFCKISNEYKLITVIAERQPPWEWNETVPLERILSACCQLEQCMRPSIDRVLEELDLLLNPISENIAQMASSGERGAVQVFPEPARSLDNPVLGAHEEPVPYFPDSFKELSADHIQSAKGALHTSFSDVLYFPAAAAITAPNIDNQKRVDGPGSNSSPFRMAERAPRIKRTWSESFEDFEPDYPSRPDSGPRNRPHRPDGLLGQPLLDSGGGSASSINNRSNSFLFPSPSGLHRTPSFNSTPKSSAPVTQAVSSRGDGHDGGCRRCLYQDWMKTMANESPEPSTFGPPVMTAEAVAQRLGHASTAARKADEKDARAHSRMAALCTDLPRTVEKPNQIVIGNAWEKIRQQPGFEECDIDELCNELSAKAVCDGSRPVLEEKSFEDIVRRLPSMRLR